MSRGNSGSDVVNFTFSVVAETRPGSLIRVVGSLEELGQWKPEGGVGLHRDLAMSHKWSASLALPKRSLMQQMAHYKYVIVEPGNKFVWEDGQNRELPSNPVDGQGAVQLPTAEFGKQDVPLGQAMGQVRFEVICKDTNHGDSVVIVGSAAALGDWQPTRGLHLSTTADKFPCWNAKATLPVGNTSIEWKIVIVRANGTVDWEPGQNKTTVLSQSDDGECCVVKTHYGQGWQEQNVEQASSVVAKQRISSGSHLRKGLSGEKTERQRTLPMPKPAPVEVLPSPRKVEQAPSALANRPKLTSAPNLLMHEVASLADSDSRDLHALEDNKVHPGISNRRKNCSDADVVIDQRLTFKLPEVESEDVRIKAEDVNVEIVFEGSCAVRKQLDYDTEEGHWFFQPSDEGLPAGLYVFHFLVNGIRMTSHTHAMFGESNATILSESLRKYFATRDDSVLRKDSVCSSHPRSRNNSMQSIHTNITECEFVRQTSSSGSEKESAQPPSPLRRASTLPTAERRGALARPYSHCGLSAMADDDEGPVGVLETRKHDRPGFKKQVYEGLFARDLGLRLTGYVLPQVCDTLPGGSSAPSLHLWAGAKRLGKSSGPCEDAFFYSEHGAGVADGVSQMRDFASYGVDAAAYAAELMEKAKHALETGGAAASPGKGDAEFFNRASMERRANMAVKMAADNADAFGASTIIVLVQEGRAVAASNLGDSGFMLLRRGPRGMYIVHKSEEQQHRFNCPFQLTRLPPSLYARYRGLSLCLDSPEDAVGYFWEVCEGDLLLLYSDGLADNIHDSELLDIVDCALAPTFAELTGGQCTPPEAVATALALAAEERAYDKTAKVPFNEGFKNAYKEEMQGGKQDDITVVAAWVVPDSMPVDKESKCMHDLLQSLPQPTNSACKVHPHTKGRAPRGLDGGFDWLRKDNKESDRAARRVVAELTRCASKCGGYTFGTSPKIALHLEDMLNGSLLISPTKGTWLDETEAAKEANKMSRLSAAALSPPSAKITASKGLVFQEAAKMALEGKRVVAVGAASAFHAGGGFETGGRHALEEAMCVQSTLYESLLKCYEMAKDANVMPPDWVKQGRWEQHIPDDGVFLSPKVEIFRKGSDEGYEFMDAPALLEAVISVAMPNRNPGMRDSPVDAHPDPDMYKQQLKRKWRAVFTAAASFTEARTLVIPDAGCGVFRNDPHEVGVACGEVLREEFATCFDEIVITGNERFFQAVHDCQDVIATPGLQKWRADMTPRASGSTEASTATNTPSGSDSTLVSTETTVQALPLPAYPLSESLLQQCE